jgi:hypothetical protein
MIRRKLLALVTILILSGVLSSAQDHEPQPTQFLVTSIPAYSESDPGIQTIINSYMKFELQRSRLLVETEANGGTAIDSREVEEYMLSRGNEAGADFVIACIFDRSANTVQMTFSLYDVNRGQLVATAARQRKQTLLVEWSITDVIADFLDEIGDQLVYVEETTPQVKEPPEEPDVEVAAAPEPGPTEPEPMPAEIPDRAPEEPTPPYLDDTTKRFEFLGGMAPFVLVGRTSDYGRLGLNTSFGLGYRFIGDQSQFVLAMSTGLCSFIAESAASRSRILLIPLAAGINLRMTPTRLGFLFHLAGGPAAFLVSPDQGAYRFKLVPYATSGIAVEIPILSHLGLLIDLSFSVYFESSQPVMGYAPSASVYYRF